MCGPEQRPGCPWHAPRAPPNSSTSHRAPGSVLRRRPASCPQPQFSALGTDRLMRMEQPGAKMPSQHCALSRQTCLLCLRAPWGLLYPLDSLVLRMPGEMSQPQLFLREVATPEVQAQAQNPSQPQRRHCTLYPVLSTLSSNRSGTRSEILRSPLTCPHEP